MPYRGCKPICPLNPQGFPGVPPDLAFNIAISFITNANGQAYSGETTLSHLSQMASFTANNFLDSAAATALDSLGAAGPHGLTEIVYAYASNVADNGSAFAGLSANTPWYNVTTGLAMFFGRFAHAIPILTIARGEEKGRTVGWNRSDQ
jgi:K+-transporting ATPase A subunit